MFFIFKFGAENIWLINNKKKMELRNLKEFTPCGEKLNFLPNFNTILRIIDSEYTGLTYVCVKNVSFTSICASTLIYVTS